MYDLKDPRSSLSAAPGAAAPPKPVITGFAGADVIEFHKLPPQASGPEYRSWYGRGQNFTLCYSECEAGAVLSREDQVDEYMVWTPDRDTVIDIETENGSANDVRYKLSIIPPGKSSITVKQGGRVIRLFSALSADLTEISENAASYTQPHPNIPPFQPWPNPPAGFKLRIYPIDPPKEEGRFGVIYRSTNLMVNLFEVRMEPRDPSNLSPHSHDDFEQCSLTLHGDYIHYLRWPWTPNKAIWREDEAIRVSSPSMTVIPPPAIHTSQALPPVPCYLIDIFSPPRKDFSLKPGWVLNADEYPMPQ